MTLTDWFDSGQLTSINGHRIFFNQCGEGEVILFIHGFPTASWDWHKLWEKLTPNYHCIALDMLGFGYSDKPVQSYSINQQADIIAALMLQRAITRCHIVSHDYGDTVAQELLARHKESTLTFDIKSVTLLNGGLFPESHRPLLSQKLLMSAVGNIVVQFFTKRTLAKNFRSIFGPNTPPSRTEIEQFWQLITRNNGRQVIPKLIRYIDERRVHRTRWVNALQETEIPLLLINGLSDPISGAHLTMRFQELVPKGKVCVLNQIGHYPQIEDPNAVFEALQAQLLH